MTDGNDRPRLDRPDAVEIVRRVGRFLEEEVHGNVTEPRVDYRVKVAVNLLKLVERELTQSGAVADPDGWLTTPEIVERHGGVAALADALRRRELRVTDRAVFEELRAHTDLKVAVAAIKRSPAPADSPAREEQR